MHAAHEFAMILHLIELQEYRAWMHAIRVIENARRASKSDAT